MKFLRSNLAWLILGSGVLMRPVFAEDLPPSQKAVGNEGNDFFERRIRPLLIQRCAECHGDKKQESGLRLDVREAAMKGGDSGPVVIAGHPEDSPLIKAIRYGDDVQMPPNGKL